MLQPLDFHLKGNNVFKYITNLEYILILLFYLLCASLSFLFNFILIIILFGSLKLKYVIYQNKFRVA